MARDLPSNLAPLYATPGEAIPGGTAEWFIAADGARLRAALFSPEGPARGSVIVSPGRTEPIEKYYEVVGELVSRGFVVLVQDWRGQGLSARFGDDPFHGHADGYQTFLSDYRLMLDVFGPRLPTPWIQVGHSMGGCLDAMALARGEGRFSAAIYTAPMMGVLAGGRFRPVLKAVAGVVARLGRKGKPIPGAHPVFEQTFEDNLVTHDRERWSRFHELQLAHKDIALGAPTWGWVDFAFSSCDRLKRARGVERIAIPVTVIAAGDERIVDNACIAAFAERLPKGRLVEAPGAYHEILMETDETRALFWREFDALAAQVASLRPETAAA